MGEDKALLTWGGGTFLDAVQAELTPVCAEVLVVARDASRYAAPGRRPVDDVWTAAGPLVGLHAALRAAAHDRVLAVACDMPLVQAGFLRRLVTEPVSAGVAVVVPVREGRDEVLCALYHRRCIPVVETLLEKGQTALRDLLIGVPVHRIGEKTWRGWDPTGRSFRNLNTPGELANARAEAESRAADAARDTGPKD